MMKPQFDSRTRNSIENFFTFYYNMPLEYYNHYNNKNELFILEPRRALPNLRTDEPVCAQGQLQCGNGECIAQV